MNILVVDDDEDDSEFLINTISEVSDAYTCFAVKDGASALTFLYYEPAPSYIFLDGKLCGMSSQDLLVRLRQEVSLLYIPIIIYSGFSSAEVEKKFLDLGANYFVSKTHRTHQLKRELGKLLLTEHTALSIAEGSFEQ